MEALAGEYIRNYLHVKRFPRISLVCKLVPVQYREYEYGLLLSTHCLLSSDLTFESVDEILKRDH